MASTIQPLAEAWIAFWREYEETGKFSTSNDAADVVSDSGCRSVA
jgi:hypothetical protein